MILFNGTGRKCTDYWYFSVGRRILAYLHRYRYLILVICSRRKTFDANTWFNTNNDAKFIYQFLQKWMNEIFYQRFHQYPRLYIHGISRGSKFAAFISRILPTQGLICAIYPGSSEVMQTPSDHNLDFQTRLLDPVFANWFYFDFCYHKNIKENNMKNFCPFQNASRNYFQPVSPTYFIHVQHDILFISQNYTILIDKLRKNAFQLGLKLLNHSESLQFYTLRPIKVTRTYMQEYLYIWNSKPYASVFFYEHFINRTVFLPFNRTRRTCLCYRTDFRYYELYPNITMNWSQQKQDEYRDYANDVRKYEKMFCEELCGDLTTHHAIPSRDLDKALDWLIRMDSVRYSLNIEDRLKRPLRIYMYDKNLFIPQNEYFSSKYLNWINLSKPYRMYAPEYYLQDYFQRLKYSTARLSHHNLQWATNPLLADYFIIPHDLMYFYYNAASVDMNNTQFESLRDKLYMIYFIRLLNKIQVEYPYWRMTEREDQMGSNHIIAILGGGHMGFLDHNVQKRIRNVIQLVLTGIREDIIPFDDLPSFTYRNMTIVYRHGYDIVLPPFTPLKHNETFMFSHINSLVEKKKHLFFFAEELSRQISPQWNRMNFENIANKTIVIDGKEYDILKIVESPMKRDEYIQSIQSSIFSLCPEDFLLRSTQLEQAIQIGTIPLILANNIVLPFERFISWPLISVKMNVSHIMNISKIHNFEQYIAQKLKFVFRYIDAFQWPYTIVNENGRKSYVFSPNEDKKGTSRNVFHYISLELRCRLLEQLYGLTAASFSTNSKEAQRQVCETYSRICPCHNAQSSVAFQEYV